MPTHFNLVLLQGNKKPDDSLAIWLDQQGLWRKVSRAVGKACKEAGRLGKTKPPRLIPLAIELDLRDKLQIDESSKALLSNLHADNNGIPLEQLGIQAEDWQNVLEQETHPSAQLVKRGLARIQEDEALLKPTAIAFEPRALYLIGFSATH